MPTSTVDLVSRIRHRASMLVDTSGWAQRRSHPTTGRAMVSPMTPAADDSRGQPPQTHGLGDLSGTPDRPIARPAGARQSIADAVARPGRTNSTTATITRMVNTVVSQNTRW